MLKSNRSVSQSNTFQAMWIGLGSLSSFAFTIVSAAVLSRFLSKTEYGTYKQVMYVYQTLLVVFTLGLPKAYSYFLPRYDIKYGNSIVNKINLIFVLIGVVFAMLLYFGASLIADVLQNQRLESSLKLFAIAPAFILPTMGIEGIMSTYKKSYINAIYVVVSRISMLICVVFPVAFIKADSDTAICGFTISSAIICMIGLIVKKLPYKGVDSFKSDLSYKEIFNFSIPLMFASIGGIAIKSADQFFVSRYYGSEVFADFANGSTDLPFVGMVLGAAASVLLPVFSKSIATGTDSFEDIINLWRRTAVKSALILYPLIIFCIFFASNIMVLLYGEQYYSSTTYFVVILFVNLFVIAPYYPIIIAFGETKYYAKVHIWIALIVWISEFVVVLFFHSALAIAIISAILHIFKIIVMTRFIAKKLYVRTIDIFPFFDLAKIIFSNFLCSALVYCVMTRFFIIENQFVSLSISFSIYCMLLMLSDNVFKLNYLSVVQPLLKKVRK